MQGIVFDQFDVMVIFLMSMYRNSVVLAVSTEQAQCRYGRGSICKSLHLVHFQPVIVQSRNRGMHKTAAGGGEQLICSSLSHPTLKTSFVCFYLRASFSSISAEFHQMLHLHIL